jgi:enediyne biosynthesis protein E4
MRIVFIILVTFALAAVVFAQAVYNTALSGTLFEDVTQSSGFGYIGHGKCTAMADFDMDGDLDIYLGIVYAKNKLFQNQGNMKFVEVTDDAGVGNPYDTHGAVFADFDNNGLIDLFAANNVEASSEQRGILKQPNALYFLGGEGVFVDKAAQAGVAGLEFNYSCGVTTADVNGDGLLDIFVAKGGYRSGPECANSLYLNMGKGIFKDVGKEAGLADTGNGYCCAFCDYDNDGLPDLYVGGLNDKDNLTTRHLYHNDGGLHFTEVTEKLGMRANGYDVSCFWGDVDNDGNMDLFLGNSEGGGAASDKKFSKNTLFHNNGDGTFTDVSKEAGVDIATNSRGCTMGDVDNDGDLDIYVTNSMWDALLFINDGRGKFTESAGKTGGAVFYAHGCALGDLDNDGDLDLVAGNWRNITVNNPGEWKLFKNKTNTANFLKVNMRGLKSNRSAVMSRVYIYPAGKSKDKKSLLGMREITAGNGTFPGNPLQVHFGLGKAAAVDVVVKFPTTNREVVIKNVSAGKTLNIVEPEK